MRSVSIIYSADMMPPLIYLKGYIRNYKVSIGSTNIISNKYLDDDDNVTTSGMTDNNDLLIQKLDSEA